MFGRFPAAAHGRPERRRIGRRWLFGGGHQASTLQIPRDLTLRNTIRNQLSDQSLILHRDRPPNLSGWVPFSIGANASSSGVADKYEQPFLDDLDDSTHPLGPAED